MHSQQLMVLTEVDVHKERLVALRPREEIFGVVEAGHVREHVAQDSFDLLECHSGGGGGQSGDPK